MLFGKLTGKSLMSNQTMNPARLLLGAALGSLLLITACDRQGHKKTSPESGEVLYLVRFYSYN